MRLDTIFFAFLQKVKYLSYGIRITLKSNFFGGRGGGGGGVKIVNATSLWISLHNVTKYGLSIKKHGITSLQEAMSRDNASSLMPSCLHL